MKNKLFTTFISGCLLALATTLSISEPSYAGGTKFYCAVLGGEYFTFARTEDGRRYKVMGWTSTDFPKPYNLKYRCTTVSSRFQRSYDNGTLKRIATGTLNSEPVICAGSNSNIVCNSRNLLFTLKRGAKAKTVANRLFNRNALASGEIITQNSDPDHIMFNFDIYLDNLAAE
ncbi:COP23 domain-containing protein [Okeanomitos corallinicola TIOX110]|uniref:COP23 domain-containing protein n=1 Tax=Okeanomitos corallinicola TIOX110 TaxID=3133117 RepID=A0ABZ2UYB0_9CYAN